MVVTTEIKVRGYHLDFYGHVNNARYLEFLEEGRWAYFQDNPNFDGWPEGVSFYVVNININYRLPATIGDVLEIRTSLARLGGKSGALRQEAFLKGTESLVADADVVFVMVDPAIRKALPLEGDLLAFFERISGRRGESS